MSPPARTRCDERSPNATATAFGVRAAGYETRVVEFVPSKHTPKNTLIRAMRRGGADEKAARQYVALRDAMGGVGIALERAMPLGIDVARHEP